MLIESRFRYQPTPGISARLHQQSAFRKPAKFDRRETEIARERGNFICGAVIVARQEHDSPAAMYRRTMINSVLPLVFVVAAIVTLAVTRTLLSWAPFAIAAQLAAVGLSGWARRSFQQGSFHVSAAPAGASIIRRGPYRVIRHPMYSAALLFTWTAVVYHASPLTLTIGITTTVVVIVRVGAEEGLLRAQYPEYQEYARSTKALVPYLF
jgi:protein-S-isoprenylcysteine O-methyltransferase Ste14